MNPIHLCREAPCPICEPGRTVRVGNAVWTERTGAEAVSCLCGAVTIYGVGVFGIRCKDCPEDNLNRIKEG